MQRSPITTTAALLVVLLAAGCEVNPDLTLTADSVELGTGESEFEAVADGDVLDAVSGGQGANHVWGAIRLEGVEVTGPLGGNAGVLVEFSIDHAGGELAHFGPATVGVDPGTGVAVGQQIYAGYEVGGQEFMFPEGFSFDEEHDEAAWSAAYAHRDDQLRGGLTMWVSVEDASGAVHEDQRTIGLRN